MKNKVVWLFGALIIAFGVGFVSSQLNQNSPSKPNDASIETAAETSGGKTLDVSGKQLNALTDEILSQIDITTLNISNNQLSSLDGIERLSNLQVLNVENNRLERFSSQLSKLPNLRQILANNNRLKSIPPEIADLMNLTLLDVSGNTINADDVQVLKSKLPNTEIKY